MAEVLAALSLATDLGTGKPMGHALRACHLGMAMARELRLSSVDQADLYYSFLLMHSGCTGLSLAMAPVIQGDELAAIADLTLRDESNPLDMLDWMRHLVSPAAPLPTRIRNLIGLLSQGNEGVDVRGVWEVAERVAQRLGLPHAVQETVRHYLERWDGKGPFALRGNAIPLKSRLLHVALFVEAHYTVRGREEALAVAATQQGKAFDPQVAAAFLAVAAHAELWETLAKQDLWDVML